MTAKTNLRRQKRGTSFNGERGIYRYLTLTGGFSPKTGIGGFLIPFPIRMSHD